MLNDVRNRLLLGEQLSQLEGNGVLHALQVLVENSIGKAKQLFKAENEIIPISAYDAFKSLSKIGKINPNDLEEWNLVIGLRNRIVHEYMNVDMSLILKLVKNQQHQFLIDFLLD